MRITVFERHIKSIPRRTGEEFSPERTATHSEHPFKTANTFAVTIAIILFSNILAAQTTLENSQLRAIAESESTSEATFTEDTEGTNRIKPLAKQYN